MGNFCNSPKIINTITYAFNNVLLSYVGFYKSFRGFSSKSEPSRVAFGMCSII